MPDPIMPREDEPGSLWKKDAGDRKTGCRREEEASGEAVGRRSEILRVSVGGSWRE